VCALVSDSSPSLSQPLLLVTQQALWTKPKVAGHLQQQGMSNKQMQELEKRIKNSNNFTNSLAEL